MSESKRVVVVTGASRGLGVRTHFAYLLLMGETPPRGGHASNANTYR